ncbi:MAG: hypothetical protein IPM32_02445 [Ignavibacteriae bacterium]|nr:hypothetical protein [Ignavibacteriota bacterium]
MGTWKNNSGNILEIKFNNEKSVLVTFISGKTGLPIIREFANNEQSIDMFGELDLEESTLEIAVCNRKEEFRFLVSYDLNEFGDFSGDGFLAPSFSISLNNKLSDKYFKYFEPLENYHKVK